MSHSFEQKLRIVTETNISSLSGELNYLINEDIVDKLNI